MKLQADIRQTLKYSCFLKFFKWDYLHPSTGVYYFIRRLPIVGSIIKIEKIDPSKIDFAAIDQLAKKEKTIFVKIEPKTTIAQEPEMIKIFSAAGYEKDFWPLSPTSTRVIDLTQTQEEILAGFKPKFRYNLKIANRNKLTVKIIFGDKLINSAILAKFSEVFNLRASEIKSGNHSLTELEYLTKSFGRKLALLWTEKNGQMIAGEMILFTNKAAHYWHNGSTCEARKLFAPTLLVAEAVFLAKKMGCRVFDFEGTYDERFINQTRHWQGFTKFKAGFGGEEIKICAPFIKYYNPIIKFFHFFRMI